MPELRADTTFQLHDALSFSIRGDGELGDYLRMQYADFESKEPRTGADFRIWVRPPREEGPADRSLEAGAQRFGRYGARFVWSRGGASLELEGTRSLSVLGEIEVSSGFPRMELNPLLELRFRTAMLRRAGALVHASCVSCGDRGLLLPAWKGTGKTSLCLTLLERGHGFLSDDRIWLRRDGTLLAFPRYLVINESNALYFPQYLDRRARLAHRLNRALASRGDLYRVARRLFPPPVRQIPVRALFPEAEMPLRVRLHHCFFLFRSPPAQAPWTELSPERMAAMIRGIGDFEWNAELLSLASARDLLFPEVPPWREELLALMQTEAQILKEGLSGASCAELRLQKSAGRVDWAGAADSIEARLDAARAV